MASFTGKPALLTAIEIGRRSVRAVSGNRRGDEFIVERVLSATIPAAVDRADAAAIGAFLAEKLDEHDMPRGAVLAVLARDAVAVKRLELPTSSAAELPDMVRLAMRRELPMEGSAAIDFVADVSRDGATSLLAVAAPDAALSALVATIEAAGRRVGAIGLRTLGAAAVLDSPGGHVTHVEPVEHAAHDAHFAGASLAIDIAAEAIDFTVVENHRIVFSRGAGLRGDLGVATALADAAIAEVKRTWLSYRAANGDRRERTALVDVALIADRDVAERVHPALAELLGTTVRLAVAPPGIRVEERAGPLGATLPLAMLLRANNTGAAAIDLRNPRQAPDLAARRRQLALAAIGLLVVAILGGYTLGRRAAQRDAERRADLVDKARQFAPEGRRLRRDEDKLHHLEQWSRPPQDVIADLLYMKSLLPEPGDVVIDSVAASEEFAGVRWDKDKGWSSAAEVRIVLEGEAKTRATADALRERLVQDKQFVVTTSGSDTRGGNRLPYPFGYLMRSDRKAGPPASTAAPGAKSTEEPTHGSSQAPKSPATETSP